jgi:hypothetical protein
MMTAAATGPPAGCTAGFPPSDYTQTPTTVAPRVGRRVLTVHAPTEEPEQVR